MHEEIGKMDDGEKVMELTISYEEKGKKKEKKRDELKASKQQSKKLLLKC